MTVLKLEGGKINFDFYRNAKPFEEVVWVLYDPETEYYMRGVVEYKHVKQNNLDAHVKTLIPSDLDEKYLEDFAAAVKSNWFNLYRVHQSSPADYAAQIPGLFVEVKHPVTGILRAIHDIIIDLNDTYAWTREKIADWLETLDENPIITPKEDD